VSFYEVAQVSAKLIVAVVVEAFYLRILNGGVHPLDLTIRPWVASFGQAVLDIKIRTGHSSNK